MSVSSPPRLREIDRLETFLLEDLIAPLGVRRFFADYWETRYLVTERQHPGFYDRLLTFEDIDRVLHVARSCPDVSLTLGPPQGVDKPRIRAAPAEVPREQIYRSFCEGFSLRLGGVHRFWPSIALLQSSLSESLSAGISVELYLTPASTQGVVPHYDNRDVFVLQIHGSKRWNLGKPAYELPGLGLNHVSDRVTGQTIANDSPLLSESVVLRAGDLLYLPRGFYHRPVAEEETSLHLSVVINPVSWAALLTRAIDFTALRHLALRKSIPPGFAGDPKAREGMAEAFAEVVRTFVRDAPFEETLDNLIQEYRLGERYPADGHFASLDRLSAVDVDTVLERRQGLTCEVETSGETAALRFGPNFVSGPLALEPAFAFIRGYRRFRVRDLPGPLSDRSKTVLARRLIREGLLRLGSHEHQALP